MTTQKGAPPGAGPSGAGNDVGPGQALTSSPTIPHTHAARATQWLAEAERVYLNDVTFARADTVIAAAKIAEVHTRLAALADEEPTGVTVELAAIRDAIDHLSLVVNGAAGGGRDG